MQASPKAQPALILWDDSRPKRLPGGPTRLPEGTETITSQQTRVFCNFRNAYRRGPKRLPKGAETLTSQTTRIVLQIPKRLPRGTETLTSGPGMITPLYT